jgi:hypothetical protein
MVLSKNVVRALTRSFPLSKQTAAVKTLRGYTENQETERVQLAILAKANGDLDELRRMVEVANTDYRDALAWAEYPEEYFQETKKVMAQRYRRMKVKVPKDLR